MALSDQELKDIETALKSAFTQASAGVKMWGGNTVSNHCQNATTAAANITALAATVQAQLAIDQEIRRRGVDGGRKPGDM